MKPPLLVGIINLTPDSFSGDGVLGEEALAHAAELSGDGADMLDIGAESTRPGATALMAAEEWARLGPFLGDVRKHTGARTLRLSVDTRHAETAAQALDLGVDCINDVGGLRDDAMAKLLGLHSCDVVVMHALTVPADQAVTLPKACDPVAEILTWKDAITARAQAFGIAPERLIYDPGIGFGKTPEQSLALMEAAQTLKASGGRWYYGHSRKSFLSLLSDAQAADRDALTLAFSAKLAVAGVDFIRVHNVRAHRLLLDRICM